jgi:D-3-phosphoglycerate dehydrogenase
MVKIFLTHDPEDLEVYYGNALEPLKALGEVRLNPAGRNLTTPELVEAARGCEIIVSHRATPGEAGLFDNSPDLIAFLRCAIDIRDVDLEAASANGILIARAAASFVPATAELALALMLDLARDVTESAIAFRDGRTPPSHMGRQLCGSTAGIIGYGRIGRYLADILVVLGMRVLVTDPYTTLDKAELSQVDLPSLLRESDFVLPLAVATEETENLIDAEALAQMKPTAILVNVSRGNLVDEAALEAAYSEGRVTKVGMDVGCAPDQRPSPHLAKLPGVVATPHLGGLTPQNAEAQAMSSVEQVAALVEGRVPERAVNAEHATRLARLRRT